MLELERVSDVAEPGNPFSPSGVSLFCIRFYAIVSLSLREIQEALTYGTGAGPRP